MATYILDLKAAFHPTGERMHERHVCVLHILVWVFMYVVPLTLKHKQKQWGNVPEGGNLKQHGMAWEVE